MSLDVEPHDIEALGEQALGPAAKSTIEVDSERRAGLTHRRRALPVSPGARAARTPRRLARGQNRALTGLSILLALAAMAVILVPALVLRLRRWRRARRFRRQRIEDAARPDRGE